MPEVSTKLKTYRFGQVAEQINDRVDKPAESGVERYVGLEHLDANSLRIRRWGEITEVEATKLRFQPGDIIFGKRRVYQRKLAVADFEGICSAHAMVLRAQADVVLPEFLPFFMTSDHFMERALEISVGSLSPTINWKTLASEEFALPPIEEQRRIYRVLEAAEATHDAFVTLAEATRQVQVAMSAELLQSAKPSEIVPLGEAAKEDIRKIEVSKDAVYRTVGVLNGGQGLFSKEPLKGADTQYSHLIVLKRNQLVMRKLTAWEGAIAVVPDEFDGAVVSTEFPTIALDERRLHPGFMAWMITQPTFWREMKARSKGTALRRSRLHQRDLLKIPLWIPSLGRQKEVVEQLGAVREAVEAAHKRAQDASEMLKSLIERSFAVDAARSIAGRTVEAL